MSWSVYPFHCISFRGQFFDIWEGDFSPFSAACSGDRSRSISCVSGFCGVDLPDASSSSHPVISSVSSCVAFELVKTAHVMTHPLPAPSHPSHPVISSIQSPRFSPRPSTCVAGRFFSACRFAVGAVRSSFPSIGLCRLIAFPSRRYCPRCRFALLARCPLVSRVSCLLRLVVMP